MGYNIKYPKKIMALVEPDRVDFLSKCTDDYSQSPRSKKKQMFCSDKECILCIQKKREDKIYPIVVYKEIKSKETKSKETMSKETMSKVKIYEMEPLDLGRTMVPKSSCKSLDRVDFYRSLMDEYFKSNGRFNMLRSVFGSSFSGFDIRERRKRRATISRATRHNSRRDSMIVELESGISKLELKDTPTGIAEKKKKWDDMIASLEASLSVVSI